MHEDDQRTIAAFLAGGAEAADEVRSWVATALRSFRQRLGEETEDVLQDALVELARFFGESRFRGESRLSSYVWRLTTSRAIERLRSRRRRQWVDLESVDLHSPTPSALENLLGRENREIALQVAAQMPEGCRELWKWILAGLGYREMARRSGVGEGALRVRVLRCRNQALEIRRRLRGSSLPAGNDPAAAPPKLDERRPLR